MNTEKKQGRGGAREGAGRKRTASDGELRGNHSLRSTYAEWEIIKEFASILKSNPERAARMMKTK